MLQSLTPICRKTEVVFPRRKRLPLFALSSGVVVSNHAWRSSAKSLFSSCSDVLAVVSSGRHCQRKFLPGVDFFVGIEYTVSSGVSAVRFGRWCKGVCICWRWMNSTIFEYSSTLQGKGVLFCWSNSDSYISPIQHFFKIQRISIFAMRQRYIIGVYDALDNVLYRLSIHR